MDILSQKTEALKVHAIPIISDLKPRIQALKESNVQAGAAEEKRNKEIGDLRRDVNGLLKLRAGTA